MHAMSVLWKRLLKLSNVASLAVSDRAVSIVTRTSPARFKWCYIIARVSSSSHLDLPSRTINRAPVSYLSRQIALGGANASVVADRVGHLDDKIGQFCWRISSLAIVCSRVMGDSECTMVSRYCWRDAIFNPAQ